MTEQKRWHIGTVEGSAFIIGILLLVVVFYHILPELTKFHDYITEDTLKLQDKVARLEAEQDRLAKQICSTNFDREINDLRSVVFLLNDLELKGGDKVKEQATMTITAIESLIEVLKTETVAEK